MNLSRSLCFMAFALLISGAMSDLHQTAEPRQQDLLQQQPPWYSYYPRHAAQSQQQEMQQPPAANPAFKTPLTNMFEQGLFSGIRAPRQPWINQQQHMAQSQQQQEQHMHNGRMQQEAPPPSPQQQLPPFVASWEVGASAPLYSEISARARSPTDRLAIIMHKVDDLAREMQLFSPTITTRLEELPDPLKLESSLEHVIQRARGVMGARQAHVDPFMESLRGVMDRMSGAVDDIEVMIQWPSRMPADVEELARLHHRLRHTMQSLEGIAQEMLRIVQAKPVFERAAARNAQTQPKVQMPEQQPEAVSKQPFEEQQPESQPEEGKTEPQQAGVEIKQPSEEQPSTSQPHDGNSKHDKFGQ